MTWVFIDWVTNDDEMSYNNSQDSYTHGHIYFIVNKQY